MINRKEIYNPSSTESVNDRKIFGGNPTGIFELNKIKYNWAYKLWEIMLANTWFPQEVDLTNDVMDYKQLTVDEKNSYDKALSQLIFMDSLQTNNLIDNINPYITSPEINLVLVRQAFEEALHSQSYAVMVDSISSQTDEIYDMWRVDEKLQQKNQYIADMYKKLGSEPTDENMIKAMFANQILEGIYFYSGFAFFYTLAKSGKMLGSAQMIRFIQRDEITHLSIFQNMINAVKKEKPEVFTSNFNDEIYQMFKDAVEIEVSWGQYITNGQILGLSDSLIDGYIKNLADTRLRAVGMKTLYNEANHLKWLDDFSKFNNQRTNFFEGNVTNYSKASISFDGF